MASAVITSRNESSWGQSMGKLPYSNLKNPNPKKQKFTTVNGGQAEDLPAVTQTTSDDAYSFNQGSNHHHNGFNHGAYVTFNVASCTKRDLNELKKRLAEELDKIRKLNYQIESGQFQPGSNSKVKKKVLGTKRPVQCDGNHDGLMKMCKQVLMKLMKHKFSWVFNKPVDAKALGLHDYHSIIKQPMDLGTVKANLGKGLYVTPVDFAEDVRLTFNNALLYNPRTDEVHNMAEQLLGVFEDMVRPMVERTGGERREQDCGFVGDHIPAQDEKAKQKTKSSPKPPIAKKKERIQSGSSASNPPPLNPVAAAAATPTVHSPVVPMPSPMRATTPVKPVGVRGVLTKQPKPRAKDLNKREMSMEEKQKLGIGLQSLPQEKMPQLVQIIRKRNAHLAEEDDEIELDIEALDKETLWELDRFVTNWKKLVSKTKRQALMVNNSAGENTITAAAEAESDRDGTSDLVKKQKKGEGGDEDVDIDDDMPVTSFPPVEIEKDEGGHDQNHGDASNSSSGSSSSSSGSSSSSDSDSGSSSGSDSDADDEQC